MAGSELMRAIRAMAARARRDAWDAQATPAERVAARAHAESRRELLRRALALGAAGAVPALWRSSPVEAASAKRVVIVGGGLAGLAAAWELARAGVRATIYEGAPRVGGRRDGDRLALVQEGAAIRAMRAAQHLHQRRLAGAVLPEQHVDLARPDRERHVAQCLHAGEAFADPAQFQKRDGGGIRGHGAGASGVSPKQYRSVR